MKPIKPLLWALLLIFLVVGVYQNFGVLTQKASLRLNLWIKEYQTEPLQLFLYFLGFFLIGLLVSYFHGLAERFKANKTIKGHVKTISKLEEELNVIRSLSIQKENTPSNETKKV